MKKTSIIIPAHNEEKRIGNTLKEYLNFFHDLKKKKIHDFEIIVVLNACKDNTRKVVEEYKCKELLTLEFERGGKGFAVIEGFKNALKRDSELIGFVDADMATPPEAFYDLIKNIENSEGIIANRWDKRSIIKTRQTLLRRVMSRGFNHIVRGLFLMSFRDTQCGAKIFKKEAVEKTVEYVNITHWAFDINLLYLMKKNKFKIKEIPTIWEDKKESKLNVFLVPIKMFSASVRLRCIHSPFKFVVRAYNKLPEKIKIHNL